MLYDKLQCLEHKKQVMILCLYKGCLNPILCEVCQMNHELSHLSMQFPLNSFKSQKNFEGILKFLQNETVMIIDNLKNEATLQEQQQIKPLKSIFITLKQELMNLIDLQEQQCVDAVQKRHDQVFDQIRILEAQHNRLDQRIHDELPALEMKKETVEEHNLLMDEINLYHQIEPKQKNLKYQLQILNMDLQHTKAVQFYEDNMSDVVNKIKTAISGLDKLFYIQQQFSQAKIPLEKQVLKYPYKVRKFQIHDDWVIAVCNLQEKGKIATCSSDKDIKIFDLYSGSVLRTLGGHTDSINALIYHWRTNQLVSASSDRTIKVWDMDSYKCTGNLISHTAAVKSLCSIPEESNIIVSCGADKKIVVWNVDRRVTGVVCELDGHEDVVNSIVSFRMNDQIVVASSSSDKTIRIWDYVKKTCLITLTTENNRVLLHQGQTLFSGGQSGQISVWNLESQECIHKLNGHEAAVNGIVSVNNEDYVVSASWDQSIIVWDWKNEKIETSYSDPQHYCHDISYLNDGESFVTCSADANIRLWQPEKQDQLQRRLKTMESRDVIRDNLKDAAIPGSCSSKACQIF